MEKKHKKGDTIICAWCGEELVLSRGNQQFHKECAKEKVRINNRERQRKYRENLKDAPLPKQKNSRNKRESMIASKNALARGKKLSYGQLEAQKYIRENNIGVKI